MSYNDDGSFPKQLFPKFDQYLTPARKDNSHNILFYNYGINEAVNVEYNPETKSWNYSSKNQGLASLSTSSEDKNERVVKVNGNIQALVAGTGSCRFAEVEKVEDLCRTHYSRGLQPSKLDAAGMINNLARDHPDLHHGTYLNLMANYFPMYKKHGRRNEDAFFRPNEEFEEDIGLKLPKKYFSLNGRFLLHPFHKFDASVLDIPHRLLHQHVTEELKYRLETVYSDCSYHGGTMKTIINDDDDRLLIYPSGEEMNEINIRTLSNLTHNRWNNDDANDMMPTLGKRVTRFQLDNSVRQTEVSRSASGRISVAARCDYSIDMFALNQKFPSSSQSVKHIGRMKFEKLISSVALSPYMEDECLSITSRDNCIRLWDVSRGLHASAITIFPNPIANDDNGAVLPNKKSKVEFGAHPRQILISTNTSLSTLDIRGRSSTKREIFTCGSGGEIVCTFLPGHKIENSTSAMNNYQALISTDTYLYLVDERYSKFPLLKWATNLSHPCQQMSASSCLRRGAAGSEDADILVFQTNQQPHEVDCYHYGWNQQTNNNGGESRISRNTPPYKLTPPLRLQSHPHLLHGHKGQGLEVRDRRALTERFATKTTGIASYPQLNNNFNLLQINNLGDVTCQNLRFVAMETAYTCRDIVSHGDDNDHATQQQQPLDAIVGECLENCQKWAKVQPLHHRLKSADVIDSIRSSMTSHGCDDCRPLGGVSSGSSSLPEVVCSSSSMERVPEDLSLVDEGRIVSDLGCLLATSWEVGYEEYWVKSREDDKERVKEAEKSLFDLPTPLDGVEEMSDHEDEEMEDEEEEEEVVAGGGGSSMLMSMSQSAIEFDDSTTVGLMSMSQSAIFDTTVSQSQILDTTVSQSQIFDTTVSQSQIFDTTVSQSQIFDTTVATLDLVGSAQKLPPKTPSSAKKKKRKKIGF